MPKQFIKKYIPHPDFIRSHKHLRHLAPWLGDPKIWHFNRHSAAGAFAVGLFYAWIPVPFQMLLAAITAILCRVNLPLSVALVWVSNPITMPPLFYGAYLLGVSILGRSEENFSFTLSWEWLTNEMGSMWQPFLLGCGILAIVSAGVSYVAIKLLWRLHIIQHLKRRKMNRTIAHNSTTR